MTSEELLELFEHGRGLRGEAREAWLDALRRSDPEIAGRLVRLLSADDRRGSLFDRLPPDFGDDRAAEAEPGAAPDAIGPYRILREIGRGGMGRVFLAEQHGDGFTRRVAVKRLDRRDASPASERRFRDEVKILAALEHSGIARFLDGGSDADGASYLVLEYVEGLDLLAHSQSRGLDLEVRLRLFLEVLDAVEYAHGQRVVHRDLKPGNVLVGADGHPKLLDFGISKLLEPDGAIDTATRTELRALTPAYASPEQIRSATLTAASDIYSLGVMLYELLAGVRPFESDSGDARALELAVLEKVPQPPSTAARRRTTTASRGASARPLDGSRLRLGRDLDAICLKALRKEPEKRYASAQELAADLLCFLEGRPVAAHRGGLGYRLGKRLRRHRTTLVVSTVAAALAAGAMVLTGRSNETAPAAFRTRPLAPPARPPLSRIAELSARFAENPASAELGLELVGALLEAGRGGDAMDAVTRLRQLPGEAARGPRVDLAEAEAALAVSEYQRSAGMAVAARDAAQSAGDAALARRARLIHARALLRISPPAEVERRLEEIFSEAEAAGDEAIAAESLVVRADAARRGTRASEAKELLAESLRRGRSLGLRRLEVEALILGARLEGAAGEIDRGLETLTEAMALSREVEWLAGEANALALELTLLNWRGRDDEVSRRMPLAIDKLRRSGNREILLATLGNAATLYSERGDLDQAEAAIAEAERLAAVLALPRARARVHSHRAYLNQQRGDYSGAKAAYLSAIEISREAAAEVELGGYLAELAWLEASENRPREAEAAAREALALFEKGGDERAALEVGAVVAWAAAERGEAEFARRELAKLKQAANAGDSDSANLAIFVAEAKILEALGDLDAAIELRRKTARIAAELSNPVSELVNKLRLAELLDRRGRRDEAVALARELLAAAERLGLAGVARDCRKLLAAPA